MNPSRNSRVRPAARHARPAVVDEWGIYDPAQAGIEALFERLEEKGPGLDELDAAAIAFSIANINKLNQR